MSRKSLMLATLMVMVLTFGVIGCASHTHVIGDGATAGTQVEERQWHVLWGLAPITEPNTAEMAAGAENYTIVTEYNVIDGLINFFLGGITIHSRTVTVER